MQVLSTSTSYIHVGLGDNMLGLPTLKSCIYVGICVTIGQLYRCNYGSQ